MAFNEPQAGIRIGIVQTAGEQSSIDSNVFHQAAFRTGQKLAVVCEQPQTLGFRLKVGYLLGQLAKGWCKDIALHLPLPSDW